MRELACSEVAAAVEALCKKLCVVLPDQTVTLLKEACQKEGSSCGQKNLHLALDNAAIAQQTGMPVCQDTGMVTVFAYVGQEVHFSGGLFTDAVNEGVRRAYVPFRKSVLSPLERINTGDNTPAVIHTFLVEGDSVRLLIAPKGFGSENKSRLAMLKPAQGLQGVKDFVVETVSLGGGNPCPPVVVGVGIGGTMEKAAEMAKHALVLSAPSADPLLRGLEDDLLQRINALGIGPQGMGGTQTALAVYVEQFPTHIAGLPVAVNIQCHCARHGEVTL